jgi:hypothetical protein
MKSSAFPLNIVLACGLLGSLGMNVAQYLRKDALESQLAKDKQEMTKEIEGLKQKTVALNQQITALPKAEMADAGADNAEQSAVAGKKEKNPLAALMKGLGQAFNSKEAREGLKELSKGMVKSQFDDLFALMELDDAQKAALTEILSELESEQQAVGLSIMGGKSREEMKQMVTEMVAKQKAAEERIKQAVGEPKLKEYQRFQDSKPDRDQLAMFRGRLKNSDQPLSEDQEQAVLDTLYKERKNYPWKLDYSNEDEWNPEKLDPANMKGFLEQQQAYDAHVEGKLTQTLSAEQMDALRKTNEQRRGMSKFALGMFESLIK